MKKICILGLCLVLVASLFVGCRSNKQPMETTRPTTAPTTMPTRETTAPTQQTTAPTETIDNGNGPLDGTEGTNGMGTTATDDAAAGNGTSTEDGAANEGRSARPMPMN